MSKNNNNKVIAIILAVLFSGFVWLYTYKKDKIKFWIFFIVNLSVSVALFYSLFHTLMTQNPTLLLIGILLFLALNFLFLIWAILDTIFKPESYFN